MKTSTKPKGRIPNHIKRWLEVNGEAFWRLLVCDTCGGWVSYIDHLAPYHTEANTCLRCEKKGVKIKASVSDGKRTWEATGKSWREAMRNLRIAANGEVPGLEAE